MLPQREADVAGILDNFASRRHRPQRHRRLADFLDAPGFPVRGGREQFQRLVPQRLQRPKRFPRAHPKDSFIASAWASITSEAMGTSGRRQRSSTDSNGRSARAATISAPPMLDRPRDLPEPQPDRD